MLRVTVVGKGMVPDTKRDFPFWVRNSEPAALPPPPPSLAATAGAVAPQQQQQQQPIKMEVGIEDCLHIEFEFDRARYHLKDVVVGRIHFLLVRLPCCFDAPVLFDAPGCWSRVIRICLPRLFAAAPPL